MQLPTNYKMGSGLAAAIMGQQAGLEAEQQGLANVFKAAQTPKELLLGQESMALLNNPEYLKANEQFQLQATQLVSIILNLYFVKLIRARPHVIFLFCLVGA